MKKANKLFIKILHDPYIILLGFTLCALAYLFKKTSYFSNPNCLSLLDNEISISIACLSGTIAFLVLLPCRNSDRVKLLLVCCISEICYMFYRHQEHTLLGHLIYIGPSSLLVCVAASLYLVFTSHVNRALIVLDIVSLSLIMPVFLALQFECVNNPYVYDWILLKAELLTKIQICCLVTYLLRSNYALQVFMYIVYTYLPLWMMLAQIIAFKRKFVCSEENKNEENSNEFSKSEAPGIPALSYITAAIFGIVCYNYFPAVGPQAFLGNGLYPNGIIPSISPEDVRVISYPLEQSRNCMPSLHLTWILCAFFSIYNLQSTIYRLRWFVLSLLTLGSAFSVGCHWTTDFFVALPFTAFCLGLTWHRMPGWWRLLLISFGGMSTYGLMYILKHHIVWCVNNAFYYWLIILSIDIAAIVGVMYGLSNLQNKSKTLST